MKREEAVELLKQYNLYSPTKQIEEAVDMAIEALQTKDKPFKVVAEVKVDTDEIVKRIKEEYVLTDKVVRCKDCKHYIVEGITTQYGWCHEYKHSVNEDDYCSYGERREP